MAWDEDRLHRWLGRWNAAEGVKLGHDAAVMPAAKGRRVACCDQVIAGVHAEVTAPPIRLGEKAALRALSDLAATAAHPDGLLCSLRASQGEDERTVRELLKGVRRAGERYGAPLLGGDLAAAEGPLSLSVTALGTLDSRREPPHRARAKVGQAVVLTGPVGGSGLGRHLRIEPRIEQGEALFRGGATAMMDVSDGLAWDLYRLARASDVRIVVEHVPVHKDAKRAAKASGRSALDHALHDGEDHELIATLPRPDRLAGSFDVIGRVEAGRGLRLELEGEDPRLWSPQEGGWRHGG